ncbi:MAG TPA: nuclear transport factor 2 family protein [Pyrinomonadaceae bacterium]|nr:nuclear transport factor 2 family protein [Pyrinomonadaceae bacterium]
MFKKLFIASALALSLAVSVAYAQNTNSSTTPAPTTQATPAVRRPATRRPTPTPTPAAVEAQDEATAPAATRTRRTGAAQTTTGAAATASANPAERAVRATFETLLNGIRKSDVEMVMGVYWNSPQLVIFNNNGTVTRTWEQVRSNRASSYPDAKNVQLEVRDVRVQMLGAGGALVTCLWTQSQEFRGTPESAMGRLTVVFRLINNGWKIVHTHTSPSAPDPSRLLPSEQTPATDAAKPPPTAPPVNR